MRQGVVYCDVSLVGLVGDVMQADATHDRKIRTFWHLTKTRTWVSQLPNSTPLPPHQSLPQQSIALADPRASTFSSMLQIALPIRLLRFRGFLRCEAGNLGCIIYGLGKDF